MDIDYNKVINFILPNDVNKKGMANVLKEVLKDFCMINVNQNDKEVILKSRKTNNEFILKRRNKGIIIIPSSYRAMSLADSFESIIEIRVNDEDNVVLSMLFEDTASKLLYVVGSNWHVEADNLYTQTIGRMLTIDIDSFKERTIGQSIEMFVNQYNIKRNDIFSDLYWDINSYLKTIFVESKNVYKVQINDGYTKEKMEDLYKRYKQKIDELTKPRMF